MLSDESVCSIIMSVKIKKAKEKLEDNNKKISTNNELVPLVCSMEQIIKDVSLSAFIPICFLSEILVITLMELTRKRWILLLGRSILTE